MQIFDAQYFDPKATLECGQLFRYEKLDSNDYIVYSVDKKCRLTKRDDKVILDTNDEKYFYTFFDLERDYQSINKQLLGFPELRRAAEYGKGIRILRQDLFETIISFIISANNNIPRIKKIIDKLCKSYGENRKDYYSFPKLDSLSKITSGEFRDLGAGFRDTYLADTSDVLAKTDFLEKLAVSDNEVSFKMLCSLKGIGTKVANCVMLFGLQRLDRFPVDVWMFRACSNEALDTPQKVSDFYSKIYGEYAGIAQQYIFYYERRNVG